MYGFCSWLPHGNVACATRSGVPAKPQNESTAPPESVGGIALEIEGKYSVELFKEERRRQPAKRKSSIDILPNRRPRDSHTQAGSSCSAIGLAFRRGAIGRRRCRFT